MFYEKVNTYNKSLFNLYTNEITKLLKRQLNNITKITRLYTGLLKLSKLIN